MVLFSDCRRRPLTLYVVRRRHARDARALRRPDCAGSRASRNNRLLHSRTKQHHYPEHRARSRILRRANPTFWSSSSRRHTQSAPCSTGRPLLRFSSPTALAGPRCVVRGGRPPDDPASAFLPPICDPRVRGLFRSSASPLRFFALRMRCGAARTCGRVGCGPAIRSTFRAARPLNEVALQSGMSSIVRATDRSGNPIPIALTSDPSCQAPPLRTSVASAASCTAAFLPRGVPLRDCKAVAAWLRRIVLPSFAAEAALMGFKPFAGLLPQPGG